MATAGKETSIYALIGTTTPDPHGGRSGRYAVMSTFRSLEDAKEDWKGVAQRTLNQYPNDWVTSGFHVVEVPPENRETFERMHETWQRAKRDPEAAFTDDGERVNARQVHQRYRVFKKHWQQHLKSLIDSHRV